MKHSEPETILALRDDILRFRLVGCEMAEAAAMGREVIVRSQALMAEVDEVLAWRGWALMR